ncbi:MAG: flippase-like domain-containing protein [Candidatus Eisenbacteria bacterium]|uniref:Flippase-like domain-containing protein n=1 Tax=Eiseniibacteriota bacterium TaxID=2212470 RepID=A0A538SX28_UNCEI|nr:MAG: flippase-like domain-containing protein [Candidatus Eisenbacteria bacterium]
MRRGRFALGVLGVALSAAAVFVLLRQVSPKELVHNIRGADPAWFLAACGLTVFGYWLRALRWGKILSPEAHVAQGRLFAATMVGFLAINTLPARLGELVRAYALARTERIKTGTVLGSVVIERIFDMSALGGFWALSLLFAPYPDWFRWSGYLTMGLSVVITLGLWLLHAGHDATSPVGSRLRTLIPIKAFARLERPIASFTAGLRVMGRPSTMAASGVITGVLWIVNAAVFLLVGRSMGLALPIWSPFLLAFVVCVAIMVPSSPGFIGVLEGSCVVGLSLLGVDAPRGLAYGILYHLTQILPLVVLGGAYAIRGRAGMGLVRAVSGVSDGGQKRKN